MGTDWPDPHCDSRGTVHCGGDGAALSLRITSVHHTTPLNYPITNCRQLEEDRALDLHEYIQENWEDLQEHWNHEDFPIDEYGYCIQK